MDKQWKALTAPLWAELAESKAGLAAARASVASLAHVDQQDADTCTALKVSKVIADYGVTRQQALVQRQRLKLLAIRRARLAGECPVYWALVNK